MPPAKTSIHLTVADVDRAMPFYEALLGSPPAERDPETLVFDVESPPLVVIVARHNDSTRPSPAPGGAAAASRSPAVASFLLHVSEPQRIGEIAVALRRAGVRIRIEDRGVEAADADGNAWEVRFAPSGRAAHDRTTHDHPTVASSRGPRRRGGRAP